MRSLAEVLWFCSFFYCSVCGISVCVSLSVCLCGSVPCTLLCLHLSVCLSLCLSLPLWVLFLVSLLCLHLSLCLWVLFLVSLLCLHLSLSVCGFCSLFRCSVCISLSLCLWVLFLVSLLCCPLFRSTPLSWTIPQSLSLTLSKASAFSSTAHCPWRLELHQLNRQIVLPPAPSNYFCPEVSFHRGYSETGHLTHPVTPQLLQFSPFLAGLPPLSKFFVAYKTAARPLLKRTHVKLTT